MIINDDDFLNEFYSIYSYDLRQHKLLDDTNNEKILANVTIRLINAVEEYLASIGRSVIQPFSRQHELEADRLGMTIINWAGYDISGIPNFWRKMSQTSSHEFDFFSTHLADFKRIKNFCPDCGNPISEDDYICTNCGKKLKEN